MKIAVIGLGYVGLPLSALLARNFTVIGYEKDQHKIQKIRRGENPISEPGLDEYLRLALENSRLTVTDNAEEIRESNVKIITVGTPYDELKDSVDYSQLESSLTNGNWSVNCDGEVIPVLDSFSAS